MRTAAFSGVSSLFILAAWCAEDVCHDGRCPASTAGLVQRRVIRSESLPAGRFSEANSAEMVQGDETATRFHSDDLFEGCKAKRPKIGPMLQEVMEDHSLNVSSMACGTGEILLREYMLAGVTETCCPEANPQCAGCAMWNANTQSCVACAGGFVPRVQGSNSEKSCVACLDSAGWLGSDGRNCQQLSPGDCSEQKFHGLSSNDACCKCGGGVVSPTPFLYETTEFVVGETVSMLPKPRTASRYGVDEDCALTEFNLTIDGATGEVAYAPGLDMPKETFSVTCKVTAYQAAHVVFTTSVTVSVKDLTYGAMPVVFTTATTFPLRKTAGHWSNLALSCAPKSSWLQLDAGTGSLTASAEAFASGAVDNVQDVYEGQMGGVCELSGNWTADPTAPSHKKISKMLVVKPKPLASLEYSATSISTAVGEKIPAVELKQGAEETLMPNLYQMACDDPRFVFDSLLGVGMFDGHPIVQVASNGQIVLDVPKSFESIFDAMLGNSVAEAWKLHFSCKIFGIFADDSLPVISAGLTITIRDTTCWAEDTVKGLSGPLVPVAGPSPADEAACRKLCRVRSSCAYYTWEQGNCSQVVKRTDGDWLQATAKIWNCSNTDTCREVRTQTWYHNGIYCPVGTDTLRNSVIYYKASPGTLAEDQLVLYHHRDAVDGAVASCADGSWVVKTATSADYKKPQSGYFEMHGEVLACPDKAEVRFATLPCGQPQNITEEEVKVQKIILDDPATPMAADYWLHPCECAPSSWGADTPVDPVTFEMTGDAETATYVPPPLLLVAGEFVCPTRNLLPNPGVYFETETESMEYEVCEAKCKNHDDCNYFWHGTQSSATTCRLYSACDSLVREMGLEGELLALPRAPGCVVASPTECWTVSMRRKALTDVAAESFRYWNLHAQCDMMLLMGGTGINACGRPTYRPHDYGEWNHKKQLPKSFDHGLTLKVSCWNERYSAVRGSAGSTGEVLTCVNGNWFNSADEPGMGSFDCLECVQVGSHGFNKIEQRREQELYYFNRMQLSIHSEVNQLGSDKIHCMEPKEQMDPVPIADPQGASWMVEATTLYERKPIEIMRVEMYEVHHEKKTFDGWKKWAEDQGGRLLTFEEAWTWCREGNTVFFADRGIDMWAPTLEFDGTKNWIQIGNVPWAAPGKSHDETWGWPAWADDVSQQGWGGHERGVLWMKKTTVIGASKELEMMKYKILAKQATGKDPRMTFDEAKAWVEGQGGRLMTTHEARLWIALNPKLFADKGIDMWVPVEEPDGTKDYIQAGNVPWAAPEKSHNEQWGWPGWAMDTSLQGWHPDERLLLYMKKELVTKSVWPGDTIALRNSVSRRFLRAHSDAKLIDQSEESEIPMPNGWSWERFTVVDTGYGTVALHNSVHNALLRMTPERTMDQQRHNTFDAIPERHTWERYEIVEAGNGVIALWSVIYRRFVCMRTDRVVDASPLVGSVLSNWWSGERMQVQYLDYARSKGLISWFKSETAAPDWRSSVGDYAGVAIAGEAKLYEAQGSGAVKPVKYVFGSAGDSRTARTAYDFGPVLKMEFSICSVARYLGAEHKGRIFQGNMLNLLHGHHGGHAGVVYYNGWQTDHSRNLGSTNWVVACASNTQAHVFIDGVNVGNGHVSKAGGDQSLVINAGVYPNEFSDWAVMELMTWNYGLSFEEMKNASDYLQQKVSTTSEVDGCIYEVLNIPEVDRTYSSVGAWLADTSMLDNTVGGFCPANTHFHGSESLDEWMQFDLKVVKPVGGVVIQGKYAHNGVQDWVWTFKVQYKLDVGSDWNTIDNLFTGVSLPDEKSRVFFTSPVKARFIRLTHFKFHHYACMRSAVIICNSVAANEMNLVESSTCPSTLRVEQWPDTDPESRHVVLAGGAGAGHAERCLAFGIHEGKEIIIHKPCQSDDAAQLIPARTINLMYSNLHTSNKVSTMQRGLKAEFFYGLKPSHASCLLPDVSMRQPDYVRLDAQLDYAHQGHWEGITESDYLSARWTGFLTIKHAGLYKFYISVDDSVEFFLDGNLVIQETACGVHSDLQGSVNLQAGEIPFTLQMYEYEGHMMLHLHYEGPDSGDQKVLVPTSAFTHVANANTALMTDASHTRGCVGNTGLAGMKGSIFVPSGQDTGVACGFVPVVKSDSPIVLPTSRNKNGHWPEWWAELQDMDIECSEGKVLMSIDTEWVDNKMRVAYTCGVVAGLGFCTPSWTDQRDAHQWNANDQQILGKLQIACPAGNLLNKVKFEYSIGGRWARFKTSCCKTGGPPVAAIRMGPDSSRYDAMEGEYCPVSRLPNGRLEYHQRALGAWQPLPSIHALSFDRVSGIWCISSQCSVPVAVDPNDAGYADPVGITLGALDVGPVSDFDGNFEAKGVGGAAGQNGNKYLNGKLPKNPPKRPKPPKKPKLLEFKPEMPTYSDKCVEYGDLWKNIHETVINDVGEEEATVNKLETEEEEGAGYQDAHPCDVAGDAGGTSGKIGGGDGSDTRDQMPYDQLDGCHARDIERALVDGKETFWHDTFETSTDLADNIAGMICTVIPIAAIEPFGAGVSIAAQDTCSGIKDLVTASITTSAAFRQHKFYYDMAKEDYADCNPLQTNFARLFCDIHCVRDAVIRGDRSIIRNLKQATDVTNKNLDQLSSWIVKSAYVDAGWLADKIDYAAAVNARDFESLKALLATEDEPTTLVGIRQATEQMKQELLGLAQAASFRPESAVTARDALQRFADEAPELQGSPNASQAFEALQALTSLKARLHGAAQGRSKMDQLGRQLAGGIAGVQSLARLNAKALGVYKHFQNASKHVHAGHGRLRRAEHEVLTNLDKIWWSLRGKMDTYFDAADEEVQSFQKALAKMQDYQQCHSGYPELLSTYKATMRVSGRTHRLLKNTWRQCSNLVGELASTLADSDAFNTFLEKEGCTSSLAMQTRNQARLAISGMRLLWHRFSVAGLPAPDTEILSEAVQRLEESYSDAVATQGCKKANTPAQ